MLRSDLIEKFRIEKHMSVKKFCELCGISRSAYYSFKNGKSMMINSIIKISLATKIKFSDLINFDDFR